MPISTSSFGDDRDKRYDEYEAPEGYDHETVEFPGLDPAMTETLLKRLGGGVAEKHQLVEGIGWRALIRPAGRGVEVEFSAHDELMEDLLRRFIEMAEKAQA